jgi:hypothetical protein
MKVLYDMHKWQGQALDHGQQHYECHVCEQYKPSPEIKDYPTFDRQNGDEGWIYVCTSCLPMWLASGGWRP